MSSKRLAVTLTLIAAFAFSAFAATEEKAPRLTLVDPMKDFGTVSKGQKLDHSFQVKNTGNADLQITAVRPTCGCTVADFDKTIKPGETGKITAHVDTTQFTGPITKAVIIESNDPSTPSAQVTLRAVVKPYVEAFPCGFLRFVNLVQGDAQMQSVTIFSEEEEPFQILKVEKPGDHVKVDFAKITAENELVKAGRAGQAQWRVNVTYGGPDVKVGPIAEKVKIVTNSKHQPEYLLSLSGVVRPSYSVLPTTLNFGEVETTDTAERPVTLRSNTKTPEQFKVTKVESTVPGVTAEAKATETPGEYQLSVKLAKDVKAGALEGDLKIYTSDSVTPIYTLPIRGTVKLAGGATGSSK
jgi:hypothetical protein